MTEMTAERRRELGDLMLAFHDGQALGRKFDDLRRLGLITFGGGVTDYGSPFLVEALDRRALALKRHVRDLIRCGRALVTKTSNADDARHWSRAAAEAKKAVEP